MDPEWRSMGARFMEVALMQDGELTGGLTGGLARIDCVQRLRRVIHSTGVC